MKTDPAQKAVLITGVSTGIGHDAARYLTRKGLFVFGSVRNAEAVARLEGEFPESFKALLFDVTDKPAIARARDKVKDMLGEQNLCALVNNAGVAVPGPMQFLDDDRFRDQIEVGLFGLRNVTNAFLPLLGAQPGTGNKAQRANAQNGLNAPGKIINISSISGLLNTPINGAYCVAKHAMESLGEIYRRELYPYGIDVISIQPGPIQSQIWEKNIGTLRAYGETDYAAMVEKTEQMMKSAQKHALPAETVSRLIHSVIEAKRPKCSYVVDRNKWRIIMMAKLLPARVVDRIIWRAFSQ